MLDGAGQIVDEMEGRDIAFALARQNGAAGGFVRGRAERGVVDADDRYFVALMRPKEFNPSLSRIVSRKRPKAALSSADVASLL